MRTQLIFLLVIMMDLISCIENNTINDEDNDCCSAPSSPHFVVGYYEPTSIDIKFINEHLDINNIIIPTGFQLTFNSSDLFMGVQNHHTYSEFIRLATEYQDLEYNKSSPITYSLRDTIDEINISSNRTIGSISQMNLLNLIIQTSTLSFHEFIEHSYNKDYLKTSRVILDGFNDNPNNYLMNTSMNFFFPDSIQSQLSGDYEFYFEYRSTDGKVLRDTVTTTF